MKRGEVLVDLEVQEFNRMNSSQDKKQRLGALREKFDSNNLNLSFLKEYKVSDYELILIQKLFHLFHNCTIFFCIFYFAFKNYRNTRRCVSNSQNVS